MTKLKANISSEIRPQDDIYHHVNAKWLKNNPIPPTEAMWGTFAQLREDNQKRLRSIVKQLLVKKNLKPGSIEQKVHDFYVSATNNTKAQQSGLKELAKIFAQVDKATNPKAFAKLIAELHLREVGVFWQPYTDIDEKNSTRHVLRFRQGGLSLPDRDYYLAKNQKMSELKTDLHKHIPKMLKIVHVPAGGSTAQKIWQLEEGLAKHSMTATERRDIEAQYNKYTPSQLKKMVPAFDWQTYFKELGITPPSFIIIDQPKFMEFVQHQLNQTDLGEFNVYLKWHIIAMSAGKLGQKIAAKNFDFYGKKLYGVQELQPDWKRALAVIDDCIVEALGKLYIDRYFPPSAKKRMEVLVEDVRGAFAERIKRVDWMSPKTKSYALKKLANIKVKVGHAKKLERYGGLKITRDSYLANYFATKTYESKRYLRKLDKPIDPDEWHMTPPTVNAYFSPNRGEIVFPAGILQPPFFDFKADDAVNYGAIGYVIGHELTHGFDDQGSQYDAKGNLKNWWQPKDKKEFNLRAQVMVKQANHFEVLPGKKMNGQLTLGENIADVGGADIAFDALSRALTRDPIGNLEGYTPFQRFFFSLALVERSNYRPEVALERLIVDPHAVGIFRANNTISNVDGFYEAFGVKPGDKMYLPPSKRVRIW